MTQDQLTPATGQRQVPVVPPRAQQVALSSFAEVAATPGSVASSTVSTPASNVNASRVSEFAPQDEQNTPAPATAERRLSDSAVPGLGTAAVIEPTSSDIDAAQKTSGNSWKSVAAVVAFAVVAFFAVSLAAKLNGFSELSALTTHSNTLLIASSVALGLSILAGSSMTRSGVKA